MFALTRLAVGPARRATTLPATALPSFREFHDSVVRYGTKDQKRNVRDAVISGRASRATRATELSSLDQLNQIMEAAPMQKESRRDRRDGEDRVDGGDSYGLGRGRDRHARGDRSDRYARGNSGPRGSTQRGDMGDRLRRPERILLDGAAESQGRADFRERRGPRDRPGRQAKSLPPSQTPFMTSQRIRKWIERHKSPLSPGQVDEVVSMVAEAPVKSVNAAVWNLVLALLGREKKYQRMWKVFNSMKKQGTKPSSRTFTTLINAYAGLSHSGITGQFTPAQRPEPKTLDRVRILYEQSQTHIAREMAKAKPAEEEDLGISYPLTEEPVSEAPTLDADEVNIRPTNSYLKFLGRFGMWEEMQRVFLAMDPRGPLAPDQITYWTMLKAANNIDHYRRANPDGAGNLPQIDLGPVSRSFWDQAVRNLCGPKGGNDGRELDEELALAALQCFASGRPEDVRILEMLIPRLWGLSAPGSPRVASATPAALAKDLPAAWEHLPRFKLNLRSATALMSLLSRVRRTSLASHYTQLILEQRHIQRDLDLPALRVAVHNLAAAQDVDAAMAILDMYQPPTGEDGWPIDVWHAVLEAARWSVDWDAALSLFRRMVHLPVGAETGVAPSKTKPYKWTSPNRQPRDARGKSWVAPRPHSPTAEAMLCLVKTALAAERKGNGRQAVREALSIYTFYGPWYEVHNHFTGTTGKRHGEDVIDMTQPHQRLRLTGSTKNQIEDRAKLAKEIVTATERLLVTPKDGEKERLERIQAEAAKVVRYWGNAGDARGGDVRKGDARGGDVRRGDAGGRKQSAGWR